MKFDLPIPPELSHLKKDARGYPIPFFVTWINGKPDFRLLDMDKQKMCVEQKLCSICGRKLDKGFHFFISGPLGFKNRVCTDPAMHEACADFSLCACPHLYLEKAERRDKEFMSEANQFQKALLSGEKPELIYLIKSKKFKTIPYLGKEREGGVLIKFWPVSLEQYVYREGKLVFDRLYSVAKIFARK